MKIKIQTKKTITAGLAILIFVLLGVLSHYQWLKNFDLLYLKKISESTICKNTEFWEIVTLFGSKYFIVPFAFFWFLFLFLRKKKKESLLFTLFLVISEITKDASKLFFHRERPSLSLVKVNTHYSFPSGHTAIFIVFGFLILKETLKQAKNTTKRIAGIILFLLSLLIGLSRICLRAHWPSDILGSYFLAIFLILIFDSFLK